MSETGERWAGYVVYGRGQAGAWSKRADSVDSDTLIQFREAIGRLAPKFLGHWTLVDDEWLLVVDAGGVSEQELDADAAVIAHHGVQS